MQQLFYACIKVWVNLSLRIFCKEVVIHNPQQLAVKGPVVIAANHPNSFFDALVIGAYMQQPVHFITRGDVFNRRWVRFILAQLNMIPIFRIRDGKDKLSLNEETFKRSVEILRNDGLVLIFVEGLCEHQTTLLPLKKGAPRILYSCWQEGIEARVLPVWLRYHSFFSFGKKAEISFGNIFGKEILSHGIAQSEAVTMINKKTTVELTGLENIRHKFAKPSITLCILLALPAIIGLVLNYPLYLLVKSIIYPLTKDNHHYDSVLFAVLTIVYPFYVFVITVAVYSLTQNFYSFLLILLMPLLARCLVMWGR